MILLLATRLPMMMTTTTFSVASGSCTTTNGGQCVTSPNYPSAYDNNGACQITISSSTSLTATAFATESCCDKLYITQSGAEVPFSGSTGPNDVVTSGPLRWDSDGSVTASGWEVCMLPPQPLLPSPPPPAQPITCENTCASTHSSRGPAGQTPDQTDSQSDDGVCDDGGLGAEYSVCEFGMDCDDCGERVPDMREPSSKQVSDLFIVWVVFLGVFILACLFSLSCRVIECEPSEAAECASRCDLCCMVSCMVFTGTVIAWGFINANHQNDMAQFNAQLLLFPPATPAPPAQPAQPAPSAPPPPPQPPPFAPGVSLFRLQAVELSEAAEQAFVLSGVSLYAIIMAGALYFIAGVRPRSRVLKLTYFTSLAASDFYSDLLYVGTQTFAHPAIFGTAIFIAFAPTLAYLTASGLFRSFFTEMFPACGRASVNVVRVVFCGGGDDFDAFKSEVLRDVLRTGILPLLLRECFDFLHEAVRDFVEDFRVSGDRLERVVFYLLKFLLKLALALVVLLLGLAACPILIICTFAGASAALILGPPLGILWCLAHVNFKLSIFPSQTIALYKFMRHDEPPDPASTRSMNLSFLSEIVCENLPQFALLLANELILASGQSQGLFDGFIATYAVVTSALSLASNFWPFVFWSCKHGSVSRALDEVIYVVTDEHAEQVQKRNNSERKKARNMAGPPPKSTRIQRWMDQLQKGSSQPSEEQSENVGSAAIAAAAGAAAFSNTGMPSATEMRQILDC